MKKFSFKSNMSSGDGICNTYVTIQDDAVCIMRNVLTKETYLEKDNFHLIRKFKDSNLYHQSIAFKRESFEIIITILANEFDFFSQGSQFIGEITEPVKFPIKPNDSTRQNHSVRRIDDSGNFLK